MNAREGRRDCWRGVDLEDHSDDGGDTKLGLDEMIGQFS